MKTTENDGVCGYALSGSGLLANHEKDAGKKVKELHAKIGKLAVENDFRHPRLCCTNGLMGFTV